MTTSPHSSSLSRSEWIRSLVSAASFFLLLCSYYILRSVRDEMAVQTGKDNVHWLFTGTFLCSIAVVPLYGWLVKTVSRGVLVTLFFGSLITALGLFYLAFLNEPTKSISAAFFIWLSLVNLMMISLFWSVVSDVYTTEQAKRCYGYITAGGTAGAIGGPVITTLLAERLGIANLMLISATLFVAVTFSLLFLRRLAVESHAESRRPLGGSIFAGITQTISSPLLRQLAGLVICYSAVSTVMYVEMVGQAGAAFTDPAKRTAFFARIDLIANLLALIIQLIGTRPILRYWGLRFSMVMVPAAVLVGLFSFEIWSTITVLAALQAIHRAGEFSLSKPSREILFTTVDAETRYKAKNFIDTAVYRANDSASAWLVNLVTKAGGNAVIWVAIPVSLLWMVLGERAGSRHQR